MSSWKISYFGSELLTKDGLKPTLELLGDKKFIAVFFSAQWCPPCRTHTPHLLSAYDQIKENPRHGNEFEIVFLSSDHDNAAFLEYFQEMKWPAIPFERSAIIQQLGEKYEIKAIPSIVILNENGEVVDKDGRNTLAPKNDVEAIFEKWSL